MLVFLPKDAFLQVCKEYGMRILTENEQAITVIYYGMKKNYRITLSVIHTKELGRPYNLGVMVDIKANPYEEDVWDVIARVDLANNCPEDCPEEVKSFIGGFSTN